MLSVKSLKRPGLGPIDFKVQTGECLAITGISGSGKSLLLRAIVDLDLNTGFVETHVMKRAKTAADLWRQHVALLPAESGWWAETVGEHFKNPDSIQDFLVQIGLDRDALNWEISRLSSGERHRLALLRALENAPKVLLLDEPTAALDQQTTKKVETMLLGLLKSGMTMVLVTHDPAQPKRLNAQTAILENGLLGQLS